ncbi:u2 small nuclear ribonucleoprotein A' [Echinococcus multilocularis]|uniref:U2 small nuclear ribonucleoprotein A n=1 Tax=Echinococcus multilocularis TaxID=6211 RepID=A0A068XWA0_ECHMU|nr:u2 small nuclear ribonucleoprotein A' [Echinococcus multilocularis]
MVKLTIDLVEGAMQYTNPLRDRELDLRGYKVPAIENLGSTLDQFDTIDFTDNEIRKLDGFPLLQRLKSLIMTGNKIIRIGEDLVSSIPNLETLILTDNNIAELKDLDPLAPLSKLTFLSLARCPVTMKMNYRLYVVGRMPQLRFLDFKRITQAERKQARSFVKHLSPLTTAVEANSNKTKTSVVKTFVPGAPVGSKATNDENSEAAKPPQQKHPTNNQPREFPQATLHAGVKRVMLSGGSNQDLLAIQDAIKKAKTMDEVERLHQMLSSGQFAGFAAHWHKQQKH